METITGLQKNGAIFESFEMSEVFYTVHVLKT